MLTINVVCVGNLKEKHFVLACQEYVKRLTKFCKINVVEVKEENLPLNSHSNEATIEKIKELEGENILKHVNGYVILLDVLGDSIFSEDLAKKIESISFNNSTITFIIGGSHGVSERVKQKSNYKLSFSKFTFPHQLMRVVLLEQIYRAFTINANITYHK